MVFGAIFSACKYRMKRNKVGDAQKEDSLQSADDVQNGEDGIVVVIVVPEVHGENPREDTADGDC